MSRGVDEGSSTTNGATSAMTSATTSAMTEGTDVRFLSLGDRAVLVEVAEESPLAVARMGWSDDDPSVQTCDRSGSSS